MQVVVAFAVSLQAALDWLGVDWNMSSQSFGNCLDAPHYNKSQSSCHTMCKSRNLN